jgi:hypothetical protein
MAVYRDYAEGNMTIDIGFPVNENALALASGAAAAGATSSGKAFKTVLEGLHSSLGETYAALEAHFKDLGK